MKDIEEEKLEGDTLPTESEEIQEATKTATEELQAMQEKKANAEVEEETAPAEPTPATKPKSTVDLTKLNAFKEKITKEFGLSEKIDSNGCITLYYKEMIVLKLLPRKNCRFGVWREEPEEDNKWKAFRINTDAEEQQTVDHIKLFIDANVEE